MAQPLAASLLVDGHCVPQPAPRAVRVGPDPAGRQAGRQADGSQDRAMPLGLQVVGYRDSDADAFSTAAWLMSALTQAR